MAEPPSDSRWPFLPTGYTLDGELTRLVHIAAGVGAIRDDVFLSYTTLLIGFLWADDPVSRQMQVYCKKVGADIDSLLASKGAERSLAQKVRRQADSGEWPTGKPDTSVSARNMFKAAVRYMSVGNDLGPREIGTRHLMAAYVFDTPQVHQSQIALWKLEPERWAEAFQSFIRDHYRLNIAPGQPETELAPDKDPEAKPTTKKSTAAPKSRTPKTGTRKKATPKKAKIQKPRPEEAEMAPFYPDHPAVEDALGRTAVAEALATIIKNVRRAGNDKNDEEEHTDEDRIFTVHIHGRWGSGKSSILNFLRQELQSGAPAERWVVVDYNAWRNQSNGPPWWTLMNQVYRQALGQLQDWNSPVVQGFKKSEWLWRFRSGWAPYIIGFAVLLWLITMIAAISGANFKDTLGLFATVFTVWGGFSAFSRTTQIGSARTASTFLELSRDPLSPLTRRYEEMIREIGGPVAVFIDDLDRCDAQFVVDLMQIIQTLFRKAPVVYVVAADRNWVCTSYEQVYEEFEGSINEPGRPLGHLFLEKIFQLSVSVPALSSPVQKDYWNRLLLGRSERDAVDIKALRQAHRVKIDGLKSDHAVREHLSGINDPIERQVAGTVAFKRLQDEDLRATREHFLQGYADLLEPNPRAMKRLLNAYGFKLGFEMMAETSNPTDALVRWTVLELRWPVLAEHLTEHPDHIKKLTSAAPRDVMDEDLRRLFGNNAVQSVAEGLNPQLIRRLTMGETGSLEAQTAAA